MEEFGTLDHREKTIALQGDKWWSQAKHKEDTSSKKFLSKLWKKRNARPTVGGVSIKNRNGAPPPPIPHLLRYILPIVLVQHPTVCRFPPNCVLTLSRTQRQ